MKIDIVDVQIKDVGLKADVVFLVDNNDFKLDIQKLRDKWGVSEFEDFDRFGNFIEYHLDKFRKRSPNDVPNPFTEEHFIVDVKRLRRKYHRTIHFDPVILWVLFSNKVPDKIYKRCLVQNVLLEGEDPDDPKSYQFALIVSPNAEKDEVAQAYLDLKNHLWGEKVKTKSKKPSEVVEETAYMHEHNLVNTNSKNIFENSNHTLDISIDEDALIEEYGLGPLHSGSSLVEFAEPKQLDLSRKIYAITQTRQYKDKYGNKLVTHVIKEELENECDLKGIKDKGGHMCDYCDPYLTSSKISRLHKLFSNRVSIRF